MTVPKPQVVKDPAYLAVVRQRPCLLRGRMGHTCGDTIGKGPSEASHLTGKSRDDRTIALCGSAHRTGPYSWHRGMKSFCEHWGLDKDELIAEAERLYALYREGL